MPKTTENAPQNDQETPPFASNYLKSKGWQHYEKGWNHPVRSMMKCISMAEALTKQLRWDSPPEEKADPRTAWMPMDSAPKDGTRILAKCPVRMPGDRLHTADPSKNAVREIYWGKPRNETESCWYEWCGSPTWFSTAMPNPIAWMHIPE